jgi:hypothetical protein
MEAETEYTKACLLRRCGQIEGCEDARLPVYDTDKKGNIIEMHVDGVRLVLDSIWEQISHEKCAQFCAGHCLTRFKCEVKQSYCYPIPVSGKRPNKIVTVMFAWYCADVAENAAHAAYAAAYTAAYAARDGFYLAASREIEKLVAAWGTPIKEGETKP